MMKRVYVLKKTEFNVEGKSVLKDMKNVLGVDYSGTVNVCNVYDVANLSDNEFEGAVTNVLSDGVQDQVYFNDDFFKRDSHICVEYLPGQFNQRADSAKQCMELLYNNTDILVRQFKIYIFDGALNDKDLSKVKKYIINPVESRETSLDFIDFNQDYSVDRNVEVIDIELLSSNEIIEKYSLAMSVADMDMICDYFNENGRKPNLAELKMLDTYWSDHCRHTTFNTVIDSVEFQDGPVSSYMKNVKEDIYSKLGLSDNEGTLMKLAAGASKYHLKTGKLNDLEISDENNACSYKIKVDVDGKMEDYLLMFKNETHNHPTEIEPFGGAATCLGGAIRDPLSGRAYVYQAMRITGSGDPRESIEDTIKGKLPQRVITTKAAHGYSSYGNQIGIPTGYIKEYYHDGFKAKRMEVGAVIACVKEENIIRKSPETGDLVILVGGATGRDGCGGATGSSKSHDEKSLEVSGAEVQKGNAPMERKLVRYFKNEKISRRIKKSNDFGAGGVSVAVGEIADSVEIYLERMPLKYKGLTPLELAISESQERMAMVIDESDLEIFMEEAIRENLELVVVGKVTDSGKVIMKYGDQIVVDLDRNFIETNGSTSHQKVTISEPKGVKEYFQREDNLENSWEEILSDLNVASNKGLVEMFDNTIGANTVVMPYGGQNGNTPSQVMASLIPVEGQTETLSIMSAGYDPKLSSVSPFHGAMYSVVESIAKIVSSGGRYGDIKFSFQEYFERLGKDQLKWGKPYSALLGANTVLFNMGLSAIGGKDSMSGTFNEIHVPPTLISFAVCASNVGQFVTNDLKGRDSILAVLKLNKDSMEIPDFEDMKRKYDYFEKINQEGMILSSYAVGYGGALEAIFKAASGNMIGFKSVTNNYPWISPAYGDIIVEIDKKYMDKIDLDILKIIGESNDSNILDFEGTRIELNKGIDIWKMPLADVFPEECQDISACEIEENSFIKGNVCGSNIKLAKPKIIVPVFPGTNCEYDMSRAFREFGGEVEELVFNNLNYDLTMSSLEKLQKSIKGGNILCLSGGFSAGDEPDGSGKFISNILRNPMVADSVKEMLDNSGLIIGICNGFQALVKTGLLPYGEIRDIDGKAPTLTFNEVGRHVSKMANTKVVSNLSPWTKGSDMDKIYKVPVSHGEGRFHCDDEMLQMLKENGQIIFQYVDGSGKATMNPAYNPNGSVHAIEGISSADGRIIGKMGHTERVRKNLYRNVYGMEDLGLFKNGVEFFK